MGSLISRWQNSSVSFGDFQSRSDIVQEKSVRFSNMMELIKETILCVLQITSQHLL